MWEMFTASEVAKMAIKRAEREAAEEWCYRDTRVREHKIFKSVLSGVRGLFSR